MPGVQTVVAALPSPSGRTQLVLGAKKQHLAKIVTEHAKLERTHKDHTLPCTGDSKSHTIRAEIIVQTLFKLSQACAALKKFGSNQCLLCLAGKH